MLEKLEKDIEAELYTIPESKKPDKNFLTILERIREQDQEEAVMLIESIMQGINNRKNRFYLITLYDKLGDLIGRNMLFLIDEANTALDLFFQSGDVRIGFWLLKRVLPSGDSRTLAILDHFIHLYKDRSVVARLKGCRNRLAHRVAAVHKRIESSDFKPMLTDYMEWQE